MSDLISREDVKNALANLGIGVEDYWEDAIDGLPSVKPERKVGKWIKHEWAEESNGCLIPNYECNQCHTWKREDSDYCPDCGADMREVPDINVGEIESEG